MSERKTFSVMVEMDGETLICIGSHSCWGKGELTEQEARCVRECAADLMSFVGPAVTPKCGMPIDGYQEDTRCDEPEGHYGPCFKCDLPF